MSATVSLLRPQDRGWQEYLTLVAHDFFHTAEYHIVSEGYEGGEAWLAVYGSVERFVAWPYLLQEVQGFDGYTRGSHEITSAYGCMGPLTYNCDEDFLACAWSALVDTWRSQGGISVFTRFHPIRRDDKWITSNCMRRNPPGVEGGPCAQGRIVAIDLTQSSTEIWYGYKPQLRSDLRRCKRAGLTTTPDPGWANLEDFVRLYHHTMERNQAAPFYFFTTQYFHKLREGLGAHGNLMITRYGNDLAAAALLIEYAGIVHLHLLANDERFLYISPSKLTIHEAAAWAKSRGNRFMVLGGGRRSEDDSLFHFKSKFSKMALPFHTGRWILDRETYDVLTAERQKRANRLGRETDQTYFPAYRAPFEGAITSATNTLELSHPK